MWTRQLLKQNGKVAFQRNYWTCVLVCLLAGLLGGGLASSFNFGTTGNEPEIPYNEASLSELLRQIPPTFWMILMTAIVVGSVIGLCIAILVSNVAVVGNSRYFLENREHKTGVWVMFLRNLYIFGWSLLFIVPGIVKSYSYMLVPYILAENTYIDKKRVFRLSSQMMEGHKMEAFVLELSFFGWFLLAGFTGGILNIFYVNPYFYATFAEFYSAVKAEAQMKGIIQEGELPGVGLPEM